MGFVNFIGCLFLHGFRWLWHNGESYCPICQHHRIVD